MKVGVIRAYIILVFALYSAYGHGKDGLFDTLEKASQQLRKPTDIFGSAVDEKRNIRATLIQERKELVATQKATVPKNTMLFEDIKSQLERVKELIKRRPEGDYLKQKAGLLNEVYQVLKDVQRAREQKFSVLDEQIKLLTEFLDDPEFNTYKKEHKLHDRLYYSFEDLQKLYDEMLEFEQQIDQLVEQEKNAHVELENRKRSAAATGELYKKRKEALEASTKANISTYESKHITELISLEDRLYAYKKTLDEVQVSELERRMGVLSVQLFIVRSKLVLLKDYIHKIKSFIRITDIDIAYAHEELAKEKQRYYAEKEKYRQELDRLVALQKVQERELELALRQYGISQGKELDEWTREPVPTVAAYIGFCVVGALNTQLSLLNKQQELIDAQMALADEKFKYDSLQIQVKSTYFKITGQKFVSTDDIAHDNKQYEALKAESKANLSRYKEKASNVALLLNTQKKALENIIKLREILNAQKDTLFKEHGAAYKQCIDTLNRAEHDSKALIESLNMLMGIYATITTTILNTLRLISFVTAELESLSKWHLYRPEYAISLQGVKSIIPDTITFLHDIRSYAVQFSLSGFLIKVKTSFTQPMQLLLFVLKMVAILIALLLFKNYASWFAAITLKMSGQYNRFMRALIVLTAIIIQFFSAYFYRIVPWIIGYALVQFVPISDPYIYVFFYLLSMPYLLYIAYCFTRFLASYNVRHNYILLALAYQRRFLLVLSGFLYATIIISLLRQAFMLVNYYHSELPIILLAVNFIIFQISLILLITKEQILNLIPLHTDAWQWIHERVNRYYYLILLLVIAVIIMSNPYVGFGTLVLYIFFAVIYTGLLIIGLFWLQGIFKKIASRIFFATDDDEVRERFSNAKTWFGILIMCSFFIVGTIGVIIGAKIWGWQITLGDIKGVLFEPLIGVGTSHPITVVSLAKILVFILGGFLASYSLNRFILEKIFDLLLVEAGVQHTVTSITQYIVVIIAIFLGFQSVGLGEQVGYVIAALTLSIGWVLKEPLSDFIAYFIILVQRPVKIGDYVKLDEETEGVVRTITARMVVLRRKNSTSLVIPNSFLISRPITNWNYARNFIAFNDIFITIDFREDPFRVKELLLAAVEAHPNVLKNPKPIIRLDNFTEFGYLFLVRGFLSSAYTLEQMDIASDVRFSIVKNLRAHNIRIAIPIRVRLDDKTNVMHGESEK